MELSLLEMQNPTGATGGPLFSDIDRQFARFILGFGGGEWVRCAVEYLSRAVSEGHICLDLNLRPKDHPAAVPWPPLAEWRRELGLSRAVSESPNTVVTPLVLDAAGRLYLRRYYDYEQSLSAALRARSGDFTSQNPRPHEGQEAAVDVSQTQRLTVISGGPGTGKTTTVVKILTALLQTDPALRIALAAPTGKAAARLEQAVRAGFASTPLPSPTTGAIPRASTLHRLLGSRPGSPDFRHDARNPLALDVLVVDEASMVPLPLMAKLFDALPAHTRVILLGDRDQLASVEPGNVLADIVDAAQETAVGSSPLRNSLVMLRKNYRFGNESNIYRLCEAIRGGNSAEASQIVLDRTQADLCSHPLPPPNGASVAEQLREPVLDGYSAYLREANPAKALAAFNQFRILCAPRKGPFGVEELNRQVAGILLRAKLIEPGILYAGMPILITQNDYQLNLFNGDIGILLPDPNETSNANASGERRLWAWFPNEGGSASVDGAAELRKIAPARLPNYELAYAMTVHKSQGSEFDRVLLILPDREMALLTRELVYTGLTRARSRVDVWLEPEAFATGIVRRTERTSGLRDALTASQSLTSCR